MAPFIDSDPSKEIFAKVSLFISEVLSKKSEHMEIISIAAKTFCITNLKVGAFARVSESIMTLIDISNKYNRDINLNQLDKLRQLTAKEG
jgi:hypothetical protein